MDMRARPWCRAIYNSRKHSRLTEPFMADRNQYFVFFCMEGSADYIGIGLLERYPNGREDGREEPGTGHLTRSTPRGVGGLDTYQKLDKYFLV